MPTRNVILTDHHEEVIDALVRSGRYGDASEVVRAGIRLVERREAEDAARLQALREAARIGFEAIDRGEVTDFPDVDSLVKHLEEVSETIIADATR